MTMVRAVYALVFDVDVYPSGMSLLKTCTTHPAPKVGNIPNLFSQAGDGLTNQSSRIVENKPTI